MKRFLSAVLALCTVRQLAAADFVVTNTNNSGPGSLYQAITDANNTPGADRILFNIPGAGIHKIDASQNSLPTIIESLIIDGYSQPGAKPNSLTVGDNAVILIQIDGGRDIVASPAPTAPPINGLRFDRGKASNGQNNLASNYTVRGLSLTGFVQGVQNGAYTGGVAVGTVSGTSASVDSLLVLGNFIGLLPDGQTARGNTVGVGHVTLLGGTDAGSRNVISGNATGFFGDGVVEGNYIGTNAAGTKAVPNLTGVWLVGDLPNTIIGGSAPGAGNVISGNSDGIAMGTSTSMFRVFTFFPANNVRIEGNLIGVQPDGAAPLPNQYGIRISTGSNNVIGGPAAGAGNVIAFNDTAITMGGFYQRFSPTRGNRILSNAIYGNRRMRIDLGDNGPTPNDAGDSDTGFNDYQNSPVIASTRISNGFGTIQGTLNSTPNSEFTLQYFSDSLDLKPLQTYLGSSTVTTDDNGDARFSATFPLTDTNVSFNMTATSADGNTSEFSRNAPRMLNISTRSIVGTGDQIPIAGFIVRFEYAVVIRALGPSLPMAGTLSDPLLEVYDSTGKLVLANDNWRTGNYANVDSTGLGPKNDLESALWLNPPGAGNYTAVVRGAHGETGIAVVEVYDVSTGSYGGTGFGSSEMLNISTRGVVGTGDDVMIAGVILEEVVGSTGLVARAIGPSLAAAGVTNPLPDPTLELHDGQGELIAANDDWQDGQGDDLVAVGLAPSNDKESAIFMRLPAGTYTAIVRGKDGATGVGLVELYNLH